MSPEGHGAQVLPDPDLGLKKVTPLLNQGCPATFPKHMAEAPETPCTPFMYPVPRGGGNGLKPPKTFPH